MQASAKKTEISGTLSVGYLKKILPKFISNEAKIRDMACMSFTPTALPTLSHDEDLCDKEKRYGNFMAKREKVAVQRRQPLSEYNVVENKESNTAGGSDEL
jgi:hypothetical protein